MCFAIRGHSYCSLGLKSSLLQISWGWLHCMEPCGAKTTKPVSDKIWGYPQLENPFWLGFSQKPTHFPVQINQNLGYPPSYGNTQVMRRWTRRASWRNGQPLLACCRGCLGEFERPPSSPKVVDVHGSKCRHIQHLVKKQKKTRSGKQGVKWCKATGTHHVGGHSMKSLRPSRGNLRKWTSFCSCFLPREWWFSTMLTPMDQWISGLL